MLTARAICEIPLPTTHPVLGSDTRGPLLLPGWRVVIGGQTGAGKTTFSMRMIRAVVLSETFLEWRGYGGKALVLDLEQGLRTVQRRLEEVGLDECDDVDYVRIPDGLALDRQEVQRAWLEGVLAAGQYDIVLVDPLYKLHQSDGEERGMIDLMRYLDRWREEFGFCLILPAHLRKADKTGRSQVTIDDISGSGAIVRGAEVVLGLQLVSGMPEVGDKPGRSRLHFWKDRDGDLPVGAKWNMTFYPHRGYELDTSGVKTTAEQVLAVLSAVHPDGLNLSELAGRIGVTERTVQRTIATLRKGDIEIIEFNGPHGAKNYTLREVYDPEEEGWT